MKKIISLIAIVCSLLLVTTVSIAQPFAQDIAAFKKQDSIKFPPKNAILFVGSSSFTKWTDVQAYFPGYTIINRGFGGSTLTDVINYANDIILPYQPKQIVIYCGENDLAMSDTVTVAMVVNRFKRLFSIIRHKMPLVPVVFVSLKPSPSREKLWPKMAAVNNGIEKFIKKSKAASFVDIYQRMMNEDGSVKADLFIEDHLHMNANGYAIWQKAIKPYLLKD